MILGDKGLDGPKGLDGVQVSDERYIESLSRVLLALNTNDKWTLRTILGRILK